jgi:small-conductance mechanosensitive channel
MTKAIVRALLFATLMVAASARAQTAPPAAQPPPPAANASAVTAAEAQRAIDVLTDPVKRAQLIDTLRTIAKAAPKPAPTPASRLSLRPNGLGAQLVVQAVGWAQEASEGIVAASRAAAGLPALLPALGREVAEDLADPAARDQALQAIWRIAFVLACAFAAEALLGWALRRLRTRLEAGPAAAAIEPPSREPGAPAAADNWRMARRLPRALAVLALALLPIGAFAVVGGLLVAALVDASETTRIVILEALKAYVVLRAIMSVVRMLASPGNQRLRLLHVGDPAAAEIEIWSRRVALVTVFGGTLAESASLLGASDNLHSAVARASALLLGLIVLSLVVRRRAAIAGAIRAKEGASGGWAALRNRLADTWHYLAIAAIAAFWLVWAIRLQDSFSRSLQLVVISAGVLILARLLAIVALGLLDRLAHRNGDPSQRFPTLDGRTGRYRALLRGLISFAIGATALIALLEIWGFDALAWFQGRAIGGRLVSAMVTIGTAAAIAAGVWEGVNAAVERRLARLSREARFARAARLRTLLPLFRTTLLVVIVCVVGLTVLSEIGVNVAPLLAGAGIVGIAIGFGSQKLVQDLITGLFLLLENAVQVGDWVTVSGLSGSVENLSIRTIRLRAGDGSVHIVPFSAVTSVTNSNRGIGNAAVSVSVAFAEDTDRVGQTLREIASGMRRDEAFRTAMLSDLQLWGVDKVDGVSATIVGQIVCTDSGRWEVQREFNRRMKQRFQELGIAISPPNPTVMIQQGAPSPGDGPASPAQPDEKSAGLGPERPVAKVRAARG